MDVRAPDLFVIDWTARSGDCAAAHGSSSWSWYCSIGTSRSSRWTFCHTPPAPLQRWTGWSRMQLIFAFSGRGLHAHSCPTSSRDVPLQRFWFPTPLQQSSTFSRVYWTWYIKTYACRSTGTVRHVAKGGSEGADEPPFFSDQKKKKKSRLCPRLAAACSGCDRACMHRRRPAYTRPGTESWKCCSVDLRQTIGIPSAFLRLSFGFINILCASVFCVDWKGMRLKFTNEPSVL